MSISNYGELQTAVENWLNRSDLTSYIPDFISIGEDYISRDLRIRAMVKRVTASTVSTSAYLDLPSDYLEMVNVQLNTSSTVLLTYVPPQFIDQYYSNNTGAPRYFTIIGSEIQFAPAPDGVYTIELAYYAQFAKQISSTDSSWLHTNASDLLLYSALIAAEPFLKNDSRMTMWASMYQRGIDRLNKADKTSTHSGSGLMPRVG